LPEATNAWPFCSPVSVLGYFPLEDHKHNSSAPAEKTDASKIPNLASLIRLGLKARLAMNSAIVKPIPASRTPPANNLQFRSRGIIAIPVRTANQLKFKTPMGLPNANPTNTATVMEFSKLAKDNDIPALANAKSDMTIKATYGCSIISSCSTEDSVSRAATSAIYNTLRFPVFPLQWSLGGYVTTRSNIAGKRLSLIHLPWASSSQE
jgi:hypothetical protein